MWGNVPIAHNGFELIEGDNCLVSNIMQEDAKKLLNTILLYVDSIGIMIIYLCKRG